MTTLAEIVEKDNLYSLAQDRLDKSLPEYAHANCEGEDALEQKLAVARIHDIKMTDHSILLYFAQNRPEAVLDSGIFQSKLDKLIANHGTESDPIKVKQLLKQFLADRWEEIRGTDAAYPHAPNSPVTQFCLSLAEKISTMDDELDEKGQPADAPHPFNYLMPTVKTQFSRGQLLSQIILSDDDQYAIDTVTCFLGSVDENNKPTGKFSYWVEDQEVSLSAAEEQRLADHTAEAKALYGSMQALIHWEEHDHRIEPHVRKLIKGLRAGGEHAWFGGGTAAEAAEPAIRAIAEFSDYLKNLQRTDCTTYRFLMVLIKDDWQNLSDRSKVVHNALQCVEVTSSGLNAKLKDYKDFFENEDVALDGAKQQVHTNSAAYQASCQNPANKVNVTASYGAEGHRKFSAYLENNIEAITSLDSDFSSVIQNPGAEKYEAYFAQIWKHLNVDQKNKCLHLLDVTKVWRYEKDKRTEAAKHWVEKEQFDGERLSRILHAQDAAGRRKDLDEAVSSLQDTIAKKGGEGQRQNLAANRVYNLINAAAVNASDKDTPLLAELAYRTALMLKHSENKNNQTRYRVIAEKISERSWGRAICSAALVFLGVILAGVAITSVLLTAGAASPLAALLACSALKTITLGTAISAGVTSFPTGGSGIYFWKRPQHYHTTVAALELAAINQPKVR